MNVTLCEECFPQWADHEVHTWVPLGPCVVCGRSDERHKGGAFKAHLFPGDPRQKQQAQKGSEK